MSRAAIFLTALMMAPAAAQAPGAAPKPGPKPPAEVPTITVSGRGEARANPDTATVRLGITAQSGSAKPAQEQANAVMQKVIAGVIALGVLRDQIQTAQLTLTPIYAGQRPNIPTEPQIVGYTATNTVSVRLDKMTLIGPVIDAGLAVGANQLEGVHFGLKNEGPLRQRALRLAVGEARGKAQEIAAALDMKIAGVQEVTEGGVFVQPAIYMGRQAMAAQVETGTPVAGGQITINASVTIRYRISR